MSYSIGLSSFFRRMTDTSNGGRNLPSVTRWLMSWMGGYNHAKYWRRRSIIIDPSNRTNVFIKMYYLFWIKRKDSRYHCSFDTSFHRGAQFATPPYLPHGPYGIIVGADAQVGAHCILYHQVTIAGGNVIIGDCTELGAGAKVLPDVNIGSHCHVGANAVVVEDMPDYSTCVMQKPRIILKNKKDV